MERLGLARVVAVHLKLGRMTTFVPKSIAFYYEALIVDTPLAGSQIIIEEIDVTGRCNNCGHEIAFKEPIFICDDCGSVDIEILTGRELVIESLEIPDEGEDKIGD